MGQPICTALQIAIVKLLRSWSIKPAAVVGHSSGEIAAAYCSGAITDVRALEIAYFRGLAVSRRKDREEEEAMMAVGLSETEIQRLLSKELAGKEGVTIGCINRYVFGRTVPYKLMDSLRFKISEDFGYRHLMYMDSSS